MLLAIQSFIHHFWNILFVWRSTTTSRKMLIYLSVTFWTFLATIVKEKTAVCVNHLFVVLGEELLNFHRKKADFEKMLLQPQKNAHSPDTQGIKKSLFTKSSRYHGDTRSSKGTHNSPHYPKISRQSNPPSPSLCVFFFQGLYPFQSPHPNCCVFFTRRLNFRKAAADRQKAILMELVNDTKITDTWQVLGCTRKLVNGW